MTNPAALLLSTTRNRHLLSKSVESPLYRDERRASLIELVDEIEQPLSPAAIVGLAQVPQTPMEVDTNHRIVDLQQSIAIDRLDAVPKSLAEPG